MAKENLTLDDVKTMAAEIGLSRFTDEHLQELVRATNAARARQRSLRFDKIAPADEPAHVFHLTAEDQR